MRTTRLMKRPVTLTVNGREYDLLLEPNRLLLDVLRDDLGLTGTKEGCSIGVCGACSVLVDGKVVSACLTFAIAVWGREITTLEGLSRDGELDPVQQAFLEVGAYQCGFCTPGQIMAARALLNQNPNPTRQEVIDWMSGNLCRCTGYYKILEAVLAAAGPHPDPLPEGEGILARG